MNRIDRATYTSALLVRRAQYRILVSRMRAADWMGRTQLTAQLERVARCIFAVIMRGWA